MSLAEIMQTKGKLDSAAIFAAMAVLPDAAGSCNKTLIKGVFSEVQTLSEIGEKCEKHYLHFDRTKGDRYTMISISPCSIRQSVLPMSNSNDFPYGTKTLQGSAFNA